MVFGIDVARSQVFELLPTTIVTHKLLLNYAPNKNMGYNFAGNKLSRSIKYMLRLFKLVCTTAVVMVQDKHVRSANPKYKTSPNDNSARLIELGKVADKIAPFKQVIIGGDEAASAYFERTGHPVFLANGQLLFGNANLDGPFAV